MALITSKPFVAGNEAESRNGQLLATTTYQAFRILHVGFTALPIIAGCDKFFNRLTDWNQYLAPVIPQTLHVSSQTFMYGVGVIEILAGLLVAVVPHVAAYVVMGWLWGIIINLIMLGGYYDVALRDFGLSLGALALARLAWGYYTQDRSGRGNAPVSPT